MTRTGPVPDVRIPPVSVVVPVHNSQPTIRLLVDSLLTQDYPGPIQIVLVGDVGDTTWTEVADEIASGRVTAVEATARSAVRDADAKRAVGLVHATGEVLALTDSDMVLPANWVSTAVELLAEGHHAVAGSTIDVGLGVRRPRPGDLTGTGDNGPHTSYLLTTDTLGRRGFQSPLAANFFCDREVIEAVGGPDVAHPRIHRGYPWFLRMVRAGYPILWDDHVAGYHLHHSGLAEASRHAVRRRVLHLSVAVLAGLGVWTGLVLAPVWTVSTGLGLAVAVGLVNRRARRRRPGDAAPPAAANVP